MAKTKKTRQFHILTLAALGLPNIRDLIRTEAEGFNELMELASYLIGKPINHSSLNHFWTVLGAEIRAQFPDINFTLIEDQSLSLLSSSTQNIYSIEYRNFVRSLESCFGQTKSVKPLHKSTDISEYQCSACGAFGVKLWRPYLGNTPLICASCAKQRQTARTYHVVEKWEESASPNGDPCWFGTFAYVPDIDGEMVVKEAPMPMWTVDKNGEIPFASAPDPNGNRPTTDQLNVSLSDISKSHSSGSTSIVPAIPDKNGYMWSDTPTPEDRYRWWRELPTQQDR